MTTATDRGTRADHLEESLSAARDALTRYEGTPCESDYRAMVSRYEARLREARRAEVRAALIGP